MKCPLSERAQNVLWTEELNLDIYVLEVAAWYRAALAELKSGQHREATAGQPCQNVSRQTEATSWLHQCASVVSRRVWIRQKRQLQLRVWKTRSDDCTFLSPTLSQNVIIETHCVYNIIKKRLLSQLMFYSLIDSHSKIELSNRHSNRLATDF